LSTEKSPVAQFLGDGLCLIVEPSSAFSSSLQSTLISMGLSSSQILTTKRFDDAKRIIEERKPKLLVTEYEVEQFFGLALIELQEKHYDEMSRISVVVSKNNSDSAVAEAAEEQIDAFILKPFSPDAFQKKLAMVVLRKNSPSPYIKKIQGGKRRVESKELDEAILEFNQAKPLEAKPTLAHFYAGETLLAQGKTAEALLEFKAGRAHQPLHYKCLTGEFEGLIGEKRYKEAYALVSIIQKNYPITSHRLGQIFITAVLTSHFEDLPMYYELFLKIESRSPELVKLTSLALLTAGRFAIQNNQIPKACEYFKMGAVASGKSFDFLNKVINEFIKIKAPTEAQLFLADISHSERGTPRYCQLSFRVDELVLSKDQLIEQGRKLVLAGHGTPEIFQSLVLLIATCGRLTLAETIISAAVRDYPELRPTLYGILAEAEKNKSAA
jgi:DNA-binding response OmpR family regulator